LRDGWKLIFKIEPGTVGACTVFEKALPHGWTLRKFAYADCRHPEGSGC